MKDLEREKELERLIYEKAKASEKEKWLRVKRTFLVLTGVVYLATFTWGEISDIKEFLYCLIGVPFLSGLIMFCSTLVMLYITTIALTGNESKLIKYYSTAYATVSAEGQDGAVIDQDLYTIRNGSKTVYDTSHSFQKVEHNVFNFSAQDSNGNIGTATVESPMVDYVKLTCYTQENKPDVNGNVDVQCVGNYFDGSFGAVSNTLEVKFMWYKVGDEGNVSDLIPMTIVPNGDYYGAYASFTIPNYDHEARYYFGCQATDKLMTIGSGCIVNSMPVFHWSENDFVFEVPATLNAGLDVTGDSLIDGSLNVLGDIVMNGYDLVNPSYGTWTPTLDSSAVSSYSERNGCYSKVGRVVSLSFHIKANCRSGYEGTHIQITNLPFNVFNPAAGGGMCSGAYMGGGFTFQCFVAERANWISTRAQACNNTSDTNLGTSSAACNYPYGGGELTLSGTITYMSY